MSSLKRINIIAVPVAILIMLIFRNIGMRSYRQERYSDDVRTELP